MIELKLIDFSSQKFTATVNQQQVIFDFKYNVVMEAWVFDITIGNVLMLSGRKLVLNIDLLAPFSTIDLGIMFAVDPEDIDNEPNRDNVPSGICRIFIASEAEYEAAIAAEDETIKPPVPKIPHPEDLPTWAGTEPALHYVPSSITKDVSDNLVEWINVGTAGTTYNMAGDAVLPVVAEIGETEEYKPFESVKIDNLNSNLVMPNAPIVGPSGDRGFDMGGSSTTAVIFKTDAGAVGGYVMHNDTLTDLPIGGSRGRWSAYRENIFSTTGLFDIASTLAAPPAPFADHVYRQSTNSNSETGELDWFILRSIAIGRNFGVLWGSNGLEWESDNKQGPFHHQGNYQHSHFYGIGDVKSGEADGPGITSGSLIASYLEVIVWDASAKAEHQDTSPGSDIDTLRDYLNTKYSAFLG